MEMMHQTDCDSNLIYGIVLDHGARHPDMPKRATNAYILSCNVSMEYEKRSLIAHIVSEVNSGFFYQTSEQRDKLVIGERQFCDENVKKVIELKKSVCNDGNGFVLINQKIPLFLVLLLLKYVGLIFYPKQMLLEWRSAVVQYYLFTGVEVFAKALDVIPKTLASNAGHDSHQSLAALKDSTLSYVGLDMVTGGVMDPVREGVFDNTCVKAHSISSAYLILFFLRCVMASNLLQVDEIMRAGISSVKSGLTN
ncbi:T-complex protein 1 subunit zeta 2-like [Octopus sinensis]|uniref:T-complex protein 1 subunit zeta 2-like n=1 Tax=Octopus sinensis TaxID=2607531 RepID=A0A6P7U1E9_9MOLL|nr:T-complex protein 1 subunit zeta 2-like [Octopus sinensis]